MNVVVIVANGLNCHWLSPYGNEWVSTPAFDALACESVTFDRHFAVDANGSTVHHSIEWIRAFKAASIETAFVDDRKVRSRNECSYDSVFPTTPNCAIPGQALLGAVRSAIDYLRDRQPCLLWIETDRLVPPWDFEFETYQQYAEASGGFIEDRPTDGEDPIDEPTLGPLDPGDESLWHRLHNSFAAAVTSFDAEMGELVAMFRQRGFDQSTAWIITSSYGFPLGEHGLVGLAGSQPHTELVHLPLFVRLPNQGQGIRRVSAFTRTVDLVPTISDLFGLGTATPANSLLPLTRGSASIWRTDMRTIAPPSIRTDDWTYFAGEPGRLYRKPDDVWEVNDLAARYPDECDRLAALLLNQMN